MVNKLKRVSTYVIVSAIVFIVGYSVYQEFGSEPKRQSKPATPIATKSSGAMLRDSIVDFGMNYLGSPYVEAGNGEKGFDCSGFVYFVYRHFDIDVPRSSAQYEHFGTEIPVEQVRKGDILLFLSPTRNAIGHIGIVLDADGRRSRFVHASSGRQMKVIVSSFESYSKRFVKAIRVLD